MILATFVSLKVKSNFSCGAIFAMDMQVHMCSIKFSSYRVDILSYKIIIILIG